MSDTEPEIENDAALSDSLMRRLERSEAARTPTTVIWTDGSCNANDLQGRGGWAALIEQVGTFREMSDGADDTSQNRMELTAICEALEEVTGVIHVFTDSQYVERCFNEEWHVRWRLNDSWMGSNGPVKNPRPLGAALRSGIGRRLSRRDVHVGQGA